MVCERGEMRKASVGANSVRPCGIVLPQGCTGAYGMLPYGCKIEIAPNLYVGTVGADSISARGSWRMRKTARAHTVRPYTAIKGSP